MSQARRLSVPRFRQFQRERVRRERVAAFCGVTVTLLFLAGCDENDMPNAGPSPAAVPVQVQVAAAVPPPVSIAQPSEEIFARLRDRLGEEECRKIYIEHKFRFERAAEKAWKIKWQGDMDGNIILMKKRENEERAAKDMMDKYRLTRNELDSIYFHYQKTDGT
jgi:hypothetical protein